MGGKSANNGHRHVAFSENTLPGISVLEPRARHFYVLFEDRERIVVEVLLEFVGHQQARGASTDTDDFDMSLSVDGSIDTVIAVANGNNKVGHGGVMSKESK